MTGRPYTDLHLLITKDIEFQSECTRKEFNKRFDKLEKKIDEMPVYSKIVINNRTWLQVLTIIVLVISILIEFQIVVG